MRAPPDDDHGPITRRALVTLVAAVALGGVVGMVLTSGDDNGQVRTRMSLERTVGSTGASELVAYIRAEGGDGPLGTGDRLRLECRDSAGRVVFRTSRTLEDDLGAAAPHMHVQVPARLLTGLRTCRGAGRGLALKAIMPPVRS